jgi:hypothetical protein
MGFPQSLSVLLEALANQKKFSLLAKCIQNNFKYINMTQLNMLIQTLILNHHDSSALKILISVQSSHISHHIYNQLLDSLQGNFDS